MPKQVKEPTRGGKGAGKKNLQQQSLVDAFLNEQETRQAEEKAKRLAARDKKRQAFAEAKKAKEAAKAKAKAKAAKARQEQAANAAMDLETPTAEWK